MDVRPGGVGIEEDEERCTLDPRTTTDVCDRIECGGCLVFVDDAMCCVRSPG